MVVVGEVVGVVVALWGAGSGCVLWSGTVATPPPPHQKKGVDIPGTETEPLECVENPTEGANLEISFELLKEENGDTLEGWLTSSDEHRRKERFC